MPVLFVGHGSPMNAIESNRWVRGWTALAQQLPQPRAVLCISAHWETRGLAATAAVRPSTIHDFGGFPPALYEVQYPAPGDPALVQRLQELVPALVPDPVHGLDHGSWSVLCHFYPQAQVPVVQLSLDRTRGPQALLDLGRHLRILRDEGVLIVGSGNIVHNLRLCDFNMDGGHDWAERFDARLAAALVADDEASILDPGRIDSQAGLSIPTPEHYLPLLPVVGARYPGEPVKFCNEGLTLGAISMRCVTYGL